MREKTSWLFKNHKIVFAENSIDDLFEYSVSDSSAILFARLNMQRTPSSKKIPISIQDTLCAVFYWHEDQLTKGKKFQGLN
jgi:hypothetical protein